MSDEPLYSVAEVARLLGISRPMVGYFARGGKLKRVAIIGGGPTVFKLVEVQKFASERGIQLRDPEARKAS